MKNWKKYPPFGLTARSTQFLFNSNCVNTDGTPNRARIAQLLATKGYDHYRNFGKNGLREVTEWLSHNTKLLSEITTEHKRDILYGHFNRIAFQRSFNIPHAIRMRELADEWVSNLHPWEVESCWSEVSARPNGHRILDTGGIPWVT